MSCDAKDGQIPEGTSTPADPLEAGQSAALGKVDDHSAESSLEFRDQASVTFNLKNLNDCRFLFGKYGDEVYANEHNRSVKTSFVIATVDAETDTIYITPAKSI